MKRNEYVHGFKLVAGYLGTAIILVGVICLLPLLVIIFYPQELEYAKYFIMPGTISILIGYLLLLLIKDKPKGKLEKHQDMILVVSIWLIAVFISAFPFYLSGKYNFIQSLFEATSGFSTTGLTVVDVDFAPKIYLMFRSILIFFGGIGLVLVMTSILSDRYGMRLYNAEGHTDKLLPNLVKSARLILTIYLGYIILGTILFSIFKMPVFDAINHSISALSTGGFSTKSSSIGYYQSIEIEIVSIILMILGSTSFFIHLLLLQGKIKKIIKHCETKLIIILTISIIPFFIIFFYNLTKMSLPYAIRISVFQFFTAITTTGFQTVENFSVLPSIYLGFMIILMLIGGSFGSTAGGIKQYRVSLFLKSIYWNIKNRITNNRMISKNYINKAGEEIIVSDTEIKDNYSFISIYLITFILGTAIFSAFGYSLEHSMFEFASALGTVGLSVGITGFHAHPVILITGIFGMFLGRLEIYIVLLVIIKMLRRDH